MQFNQSSQTDLDERAEPSTADRTPSRRDTSADLQSSESSAPQNGPATAIQEGTGWAGWLLRRLLGPNPSLPLRIRLWDGRVFDLGQSEPTAEVTFRQPMALMRMLRDPEYHFAEGYSRGDIEVRGDLVDLIEVGYRAVNNQGSRRSNERPARLGRGMVSRWRNSLAGSRRNIHHHYDIGNDFYRLWLDEEMVYTCAYFARPEMTLEQAQRAKMDHVAHKVQLKPGQQVIEAGCGWGSLAIHLAKHHGVSVRAYNISAEQVDYARKRAEAEGLTDRVSFIQDDYRNISGQCDAFVSVGMLEHVGQENYEALGAAIHRVLKPNGRGLIHTIGRNRSRSLSKWIHQRIFPGADPPTMAEMMRIFEPYDMSLLDAENLRLHYAQTLRHWLERFEANADQVEKMFGPRFVRTWRMYLSGSVAGFTVGGLQLFQVAFARGSDNTVPRTREHMYRPGVFPHDPTVEGTLSFADAGPDLPRSSSEPTQQDQPAQQQAAQGQPA